ncbi:hypothetical protein [Exilibacterium tricleocarpae]|nr:hypothetical protein [Exilibacterium tricleocarpae]
MARQTGWGLHELLSLEEPELLDWLETGTLIKRQQDMINER